MPTGCSDYPVQFLTASLCSCCRLCLGFLLPPSYSSSKAPTCLSNPPESFFPSRNFLLLEVPCAKTPCLPFPWHLSCVIFLTQVFQNLRRLWSQRGTQYEIFSLCAWSVRRACPRCPGCMTGWWGCFDSDFDASTLRHHSDAAVFDWDMLIKYLDEDLSLFFFLFNHCITR